MQFDWSVSPVCCCGGWLEAMVWPLMCCLAWASLRTSILWSDQSSTETRSHFLALTSQLRHHKMSWEPASHGTSRAGVTVATIRVIIVSTHPPIRVQERGLIVQSECWDGVKRTVPCDAWDFLGLWRVWSSWECGDQTLAADWLGTPGSWPWLVGCLIGANYLRPRLVSRWAELLV